MKEKYKTPEIKAEELLKIDVLCDSDESSDNTKYNGRYNVEFSAKQWTLEDLL